MHVYIYIYVHIYLGHFNRALDMMNHAVSGTYQPGIKENMAYFTTNEKRYVTIALDYVHMFMTYIIGLMQYHHIMIQQR